MKNIFDIISTNSRALALKLRTNPAWAKEILASPYASQRKPKSIIEKELASETSVIALENAASFDRALRHYKYREMIRLMAKEFAGRQDTKEMLDEWSDIADTLINAAYNRAFTTASEKIIPANSSGFPCSGSVIALGKLGGQELNLSSDVDIIIIYERDDGYAGIHSEITNHEFFVDVAILMTKYLSRQTPDGFVFRVDHDLRPEGRQGTLANSLEAAIRYYEHFGLNWERHALIRARAAAGDKDLGAKFIVSVGPFVYRRSISINDISHMRDLKIEMEKKVSEKNRAIDIKHSKGCIRELEFLVQALQSLHGGASTAVRCTNTFDAIDALSMESFIHPGVAAVLKEAWGFLRRLENMIQVEDDLQTHLFPADPEGVGRLAARMGLGADELTQSLARHTENVAKLFEALFERDYERQELEAAIRDNLNLARDREEQADSLAWFRTNETRRLAAFDLQKKIQLRRLLERLSVLAEAVIQCAWEMTDKALTEQYGRPLDLKGAPAQFAIVGLGKLGSKEMDYGSDLDLCFLYSGDGKTNGTKVISSCEYFTKQAQRIISALSLPTRYGRAYLVDSELRPSGRSGKLVATLESFIDYHKHSALIWERLALLKARAIAGNEPFTSKVSQVLKEIAFKYPPPSASDVRRETDRLRIRAIGEKASSCTSVFNMKTDSGTVADIEAVVGCLQLEHASQHESLERHNTFEIIESLINCGIIDGQTGEALSFHLAFYRRLSACLRLISASSADSLDSKAPFISALAEQMEFSLAEELFASIAQRRQEVRTIYNKIVLENL